MSNTTKEPFSLGYKKLGLPKQELLEKLVKSETTDNSIEYSPFHIHQLQHYNPIYKEIFELSPTNYNSIGLNHPNQHVFNLERNSDSEVTIDNCFIKYSPLLDPFRYLTGKYKSDDSLKTLPKIDSPHSKLADPNNASYIDNFFCYLSSQLKNHHSFINAIDYYGSYIGIQEKFKINISDDMDYLRNSEIFIQNRNILYEIEEDFEDPLANFGSRKNKDKLVFHNESAVSHLSFDNIDVEDTNKNIIDNTKEDIEQIYEHSDSDDESSNNSQLSYTSSDDSDEESGDEDTESDDDEDNEESDDDDESDDDEDEDTNESDDEESDTNESDSEDSDAEDSDSQDTPIYAYIKEFPVQLICLEPCKNTMDSLFEKGELDEKTAAAALMQVIMSLLAFQKSFHFTHNDLHTNNIMYIDTTEEFLYYRFNKIVYKVPTYGRLYKIIDFGRAIYKFQGRTYCSDSFSPDGDANSQYNFEPYFNDKKPRLEPNYSFDLCRLGCSIFDFILDEDYLQQEELEFDELQRTVIRWCSDDNGKNVLYKKSGEERYPNFKLYKMIARTVHKHTPELQLTDPYFSKYALDKKQVKNIQNNKIIDIDILPCYVSK